MILAMADAIYGGGPPREDVIQCLAAVALVAAIVAAAAFERWRDRRTLSAVETVPDRVPDPAD